MRKTGTARRTALSVAAIHPQTGKTVNLLLSHAKLQAISRRSRGQILECAELVPMALQEPSAIFRGLRREHDEPHQGCGRLCYCGVPSKAYSKDGQQLPPWPGEVFLVFVSEDDVVYNWYGTKCDPDDANLPKNFSVQYRERLI